MRRGCVWPIRPLPPAPRPRPSVERDLGQLRRLARAGLAADDDDLMRRGCARAISSRRAQTGSDSGKSIGGIAVAARAGLGAAWVACAAGSRGADYRRAPRRTVQRASARSSPRAALRHNRRHHEPCLPAHLRPLVPLGRAVHPRATAARPSSSRSPARRSPPASCNAFAQDLAILHAMGIKLVLVHGFRPQVNEQLRAKGHASRFAHGLRITDEVALDCAQEAAGQLRFEIEAAFSQGLPNTPMANATVRVRLGQLPHRAAGRHRRRRRLPAQRPGAQGRRRRRSGARSTSARWCCCRRSASRPPARPST